MAVKRSRARFPEAPLSDAPDRWLSVDPASGSKPTVATVWDAGEPVRFAAIRHDQHDSISAAMDGAGLVVLEGGGFVGSNAATALALERVRGRFETWAKSKGIPYVEVRPDGWRGVLALPARPRRRAELAGRALCRTLAKREGFAALATNDDKRAAYLLGRACVQAWGWG